MKKIQNFGNKTMSVGPIETLVTELVQEFFNQFGIKCDRHESYHLWLAHYYNFRLKYITPSPRKIYISKELSANMLTHPAKGAIFDIIYKAGAGKEVNPHQSKSSFNASFDDGLFNDWGIHHLHISNAKKKKSEFFFDRSDHLLFVRFTNDEAFFLNSYLHKKKTLWGNRDLIRVIQKNWPWSIADRETPGLIFPDLSDEEIEDVRNAGCLFGINVDGKGYMLLGHGQASSGFNLMAGRLADMVVRWIGENLSLFDSDRPLFTNQLKEKMQLA